MNTDSQVGYVLAWSYYVGYLRFVLDDEYWDQKLPDDLTKRKLLILIPQSTPLPNIIPDFSPNEITALEPRKVLRAGQIRAFGLTKYTKDGRSFLLEYPATLVTLDEMSQFGGAENLTEKYLEAFSDTLVEILKTQKNGDRAEVIKYVTSEELCDKLY